MKKFIPILFCLAACGGKSSLNTADQDYVRTSIDLIRTRASFTVNQDSLAIERSLDSVYARHHTSAKQYQDETVALSSDRDRTAAIFAAINESIGK